MLKISISPKKVNLPKWIRREEYFPILLNKIAKTGRQAIRKRILNSAWKSPRAAKSIARDLHVLKKKRVVSFYFTKPYVIYHEYGVKRQKMRWLVGISKVIPIRRNNEIIFRWAPKTLKDAWVHPGLKAKHFFRKGIEDLKKKFKSITNRTLKKFIAKYKKTTPPKMPF